MNVRSTMTSWVLLISSAAMAAVSLLATLAAVDAADLQESWTLEQAMHSSTVATLTFALVAGLVNATSDYRHGRIDQLLLTSPGGREVLLSKAAVVMGIGVLYALVGGVVALVGIRVWYGLNDVPVDLTSAAVVQPLTGAVIACALFSLIGLGVGTAVRNQPAAIAGSLFLLLIVQPPALLGAPDLGRWLPGAAGLSVTFAPDDALLAPVVGGVVLGLWSVIAIAAGSSRLTRAGAG